MRAACSRLTAYGVVARPSTRCRAAVSTDKRAARQPSGRLCRSREPGKREAGEASTAREIGTIADRVVDDPVRKGRAMATSKRVDLVKQAIAAEPAKRALSLVEEFKNFALKGNVIDLAVGVIIGAAFGKIVDSLVKHIMMP